MGHRIAGVARRSFDSLSCHPLEDIPLAISSVLVEDLSDLLPDLWIGIVPHSLQGFNDDFLHFPGRTVTQRMHHLLSDNRRRVVLHLQNAIPNGLNVLLHVAGTELFQRFLSYGI